jgi:hypothetical protein
MSRRSERRLRNKLRPTLELVLAKVNQLFPQDLVRSAVDVLDEYRARDDDDEGRRRVQLAVLKLSSGDLARLRDLVVLALEDFRDVINLAESPGLKGRWGMSEEERQQVIAQDREAYVAWLLGHEKSGEQ